MDCGKIPQTRQDSPAYDPTWLSVTLNSSADEMYYVGVTSNNTSSPNISGCHTVTMGQQADIAPFNYSGSQAGRIATLNTVGL